MTAGFDCAERRPRVRCSSCSSSLVAFAFMLRAHDRTPWSLTDEETRGSGMRECEDRAARYDLPPLRRPPGWPVGSYERALTDATQAALDLGAIGVPTTVVGGALFWGDDRLEEAAAG